MSKTARGGSQDAAESAALVAGLSPFVSDRGELPLSNLGQLELLRGVAERGQSLRTRVRGLSMAPLIRDEDVLTIAPMHGRGPRVGEVVAFTVPGTGKLAVHRVVAREGGGWLLRGDNCLEADGVVMSDEIVGRVVRVERNGHDVRICTGVGGALIAALSRGDALVHSKALWHVLRRVASFVLRRAQGLASYRAIGRRLAPHIDVVEAREDEVAAVQLRLNPGQPYRRQPPNPDVTNWVAKRRGTVIGFVQLVNHPESGSPWAGHWLFSLIVWGRYRGLGAGEALTRRVIEQARSQGAAQLLLAVFEDDKRAMRFYRKLGFGLTTLEALEPEFASEKQRSGRCRVVMGRRLVADS